MILVPVTVTLHCWNALHYTLYIISVKCFLFFSGLADQQEEYLYAGCSRSISWYISFFVTHRTWSAVSSTRLLQYSRSIRAATVTYSSWCSRIVSVHQSIWKKEEHYTCHWGSGFVFLIAYLTIYIIIVIFVLKNIFCIILYHSWQTCYLTGLRMSCVWNTHSGFAFLSGVTSDEHWPQKRTFRDNGSKFNTCQMPFVLVKQPCQFYLIAFIALTSFLTLLVAHQEEYPVCNKKAPQGGWRSSPPACMVCCGLSAVTITSLWPWPWPSVRSRSHQYVQYI